MILEKLRQFLLRQGLGRGVLLFTIGSIVLSLSMTVIVATLWAGGPGVVGLSIAVIVPAMIAPLFSSVQLRLLFELEQARKDMRMLAMTDDVTRAFNHRHFRERAERELDRARRGNTALSVLLFDVDNFKTVNDTYGHLGGDMVLRTISRACIDLVRQHDVFARYGGDEFLVLLPETDAATALAVAERIRQRIAASPGQSTSGSVQVTISVGVTTLSQDILTLDAFLNRADQALYHAKSAGKNCVVIA